MQPDLFAGPALRDDRHRILARLANGGSVPAPERHWIGWAPPQRARLAAVATLLAASAAAWVWLQRGDAVPERPPGSPGHTSLPDMPAVGSAPRDEAISQAATIVTPAPLQSEEAAAPPATKTPMATAAGATRVAERASDAKPVHARPARLAGTPRRQQAFAAAPESDEDVTLLAAMLKHAKPQQPAPTPPKD